MIKDDAPDPAKILKLARRALTWTELGAAHTERDGGVALERRDVDVGEPAPELLSPGQILDRPGSRSRSRHQYAHIAPRRRRQGRNHRDRLCRGQGCPHRHQRQAGEIGRPQAGNAHHRSALRRQAGPGVVYLSFRNHLDMATAIASCKLFIGNQSSCFAIAQGLDVPRVLEVCPVCCNVPIHGRNGYDVISQPLFEGWVKHLAAP